QGRGGRPQELGGRHLEGVATRGAHAGSASGPAAGCAARTTRCRSEVARPVPPGAELL
ncbi:unnamed protein product, partial [Prorocentrum cordatum]